MTKLTKRTISTYLPDTSGVYEEGGKTYLRPDLTRDVDDPVNAKVVQRVSGKVFAEQSDKVSHEHRALPKPQQSDPVRPSSR